MMFEVLMAVTVMFSIFWGVRRQAVGELQPDYLALHKLMAFFT
jgi:hypothetical protein